MRTLLYRASAQISIVSARGTLVKRLETSKGWKHSLDKCQTKSFGKYETSASGYSG